MSNCVLILVGYTVSNTKCPPNVVKMLSQVKAFNFISILSKPCLKDRKVTLRGEKRVLMRVLIFIRTTSAKMYSFCGFMAKR